MFSPLRSIRERFGTAGLIVAIVALVAALAGTAVAAGGLTGKQKKEVKKIAKKFAGKRGPAGPQGPVGPGGAKGDNGAPGQNGAAGAPGKDGLSVAGTPIAAGGACGVGVTGVKYTLGATSTNICNGKNGADGQTGFVETLPSGESLYGTWSYGRNGSDALLETASVSFGIPLSEAPEVVFVEKGGEEEACPGTEQAPAADPGVLCVYVDLATGFGGKPPVLVGSFKFGAYLGFEMGEGQQGLALGTWAVTAP